MWTLGTLASGVLGTTQTDLYSPIYPTVVRGIRVSNQSGVSVTCTIYLTTLGGSTPLCTPSIPLGANESVLIDTPVMLGDSGDDSIQGVGSTSSGISYIIWGVTKR